MRRTQPRRSGGAEAARVARAHQEFAVGSYPPPPTVWARAQNLSRVGACDQVYNPGLYRVYLAAPRLHPAAWVEARATIHLNRCPHHNYYGFPARPARAARLS